jgi:predicted metal-dependent hydrolase
MPVDPYREGLRLFNQAEFFAAHELLEDVWRIAPPGERRFLQGLIQVAVALHHHSTGNLAGCRSVLARACDNLAAYPAEHGGLDLAALLATLARWRSALDGNRAPPPPPMLVVSG